MNLQPHPIRIIVAVLGAAVVGFIGYAGFLQSIHDPTFLSKAMFAIGLPLLALVESAEVLLPIAGSVTLWAVALYAVIGVLTFHSRRTP